MFDGSGTKNTSQGNFRSKTLMFLVVLFGHDTGYQVLPEIDLGVKPT